MVDNHRLDLVLGGSEVRPFYPFPLISLLARTRSVSVGTLGLRLSGCPSTKAEIPCLRSATHWDKSP